MSSLIIGIVDLDVREEIPVHLFEDYELESAKMEHLNELKEMEIMYEYYTEYKGLRV